MSPTKMPTLRRGVNQQQQKGEQSQTKKIRIKQRLRVNLRCKTGEKH